MRGELLRARAREIATLVRGGEPVCVVSSGAIALGLPRLGLDRRPRSDAAAPGGLRARPGAPSGGLGRGARAAGLAAAQVLLTAGDVADRTAYVNARQALAELLPLGAVPVVNENDATATDEITFGDNDALAAQVAVLVRARLLVLLTEVEGVYTRAPGRPAPSCSPRASVAGEAELGAATALGRGGMRSKVLAARDGGRGRDPDGDRRRPRRRRPGADPRRRAARHPLRARPTAASRRSSSGCASASRSRGRLARRRGRARGRSSRRARACSASASFAAKGGSSAGDAVELVGPDGAVFGKGIASAGTEDLAGRPRDLEAVHRDRLVLY